MRIMVWGAVICVGILFALPASAHEWQTKNGFLVLLHADPDDSPIAREPARLYFHFKPPAGTPFDVAQCDCTVSIAMQDGTAIGESKVSKVADTRYGSETIAVDATFPKRAAYAVSLTVLHPGVEPFMLAYTLRVERGSNEQTPWLSTHTVHIGSALLAACVGVIFVAYEHYRKKRGA